MTTGGRRPAVDGSARERVSAERPPPRGEQFGFGSALSGVRPAVRVVPGGAGAALGSALVEASSGRVLRALSSASGSENLVEFATAVPELLGAPNPARSLALGSLKGTTSAPLRDLVLVSPARVHVAQRTERDPDRVVLCVTERGPSIGWIVSQARAVASEE
jgi:hypothetical protein